MSKQSEFLRADNEHITLQQKKSERKQSAVCVFVYAVLWSGARSCYAVATRTWLLYMRQRFASKVIAVLFSSPLPPTMHTHICRRAHRHLYIINSVLSRGGEVRGSVECRDGLGMMRRRVVEDVQGRGQRLESSSRQTSRIEEM